MQQMCERCSVIEGKNHPLYDDKVKLYKISYKSKEMSVCQYCKIQLEAKESLEKSKSANDSFLTTLKNLFNSH